MSVGWSHATVCQVIAATGPNGCGKSTLLSKLASRELPVPESLELVFVEQEAAPTDTSVSHSIGIISMHRM